MPPQQDPCARIVSALSEGDPLTEDLHAHAGACAACGALLKVPAALDVRSDFSLTPGPALLEALREARPVRRPSALLRALPSGLVMLASLAASALLGRAGSSGWLAGLALTLVASAGLALVFWRGADGLGSPARLRRTYPILAAVAVVVAAASRAPELASLRAALGRLPSPGTAVDAVSRAPRGSSDDLAATLASAALLVMLSAVAGLLGARHTTPRQPALTGATLGAASALLGLAVMHHGAPMPMVAQVATVIAASMLCARFGRRVLSP